MMTNRLKKLFKKLRLGNKKIWIVAITILIITTLVCIVVIKDFWPLSKTDTESTPVGVCNNSSNSTLYSWAAAAIDTGQADARNPVIEKIKGDPGHKHDPNCLYPLVMDRIFVKDYKNAKRYFDQLSKAYDPKIGFAPVYKNRVNSLEDLEKKVDSANIDTTVIYGLETQLNE